MMVLSILVEPSRGSLLKRVVRATLLMIGDAPAYYQSNPHYQKKFSDKKKHLTLASMN
jgi:accessory gene regulator protein AgrB